MGRIRGHEDAIDEGIRTLKTIGKYNPDMLWNIERGMTPTRAADGIWGFCLLAGVTYWAVSINSSIRGCLCVDHYSQSRSLFTYGLVLLACAVSVRAVWICGDRAIWWSDSLFWS